MLFLDYCTDLMPILHLLRRGIIPLIQFGVPIILILYGMIDFAKMVVASKEDEIKSAQKLLLKRFIYAVCVFFVVTIVTLVFNLLVEAGDTSQANSWKDCWSRAK